MNHISQKDVEFLNQYDGSVYDKPSITVDLLIFTIQDDELKIVLIKREKPPFKEMLSLPGAFVKMEETLEQAAGRVLSEKVQLSDIYLEQLYTWGNIERDPRMRVISVSYIAIVPIEKLKTADETGTICSNLYSIPWVLQENNSLAFDHKQMIAYGRERIRNKVEYTELAFEFLPLQFTLPHLQKVYEILLGRELYKANFRKKIHDMVTETEELFLGGAHRPSRLYRRS